MQALSWKEVSSEGETALAVGNFDGVHLGHQSLIKKALEFAEAKNLTPAVLTFHPHPLKVFKREKFLTLTPVEEKQRLIKLYGIQRVYLLKFDEELYNLSAREFVEEVLVGRLKCKALVVGENFRFGRKREGDVKLLQKLSRIYGFEFFAHPVIHINDMHISSTRIRRFLREGRVEEAARLLGRPYKLIGRVIKGQGRGKSLGFPTANLECENEVIPRNGVYACFAEVKGSLMKSVVNIGCTPTFGGEEITIEAHIIGLNEDIYGNRVGLYFIKRLREERKFGSIEELKAAIKRDRDFGEEFLQWERFCVSSFC